MQSKSRFYLCSEKDSIVGDGCTGQRFRPASVIDLSALLAHHTAGIFS